MEVEELSGWFRGAPAWSLGAGPRAGQALLLCGKARALLDGRATVSIDDIRALAPPVLRHRVLLNFQAEAEGLTADAIVDRLLAAVPAAAR